MLREGNRKISFCLYRGRCRLRKDNDDADEDMQKQWQVLTLPHTEVRRILQNGSKAQLFRRMQRSKKRILSGSTADTKDILC